MSKEDYSIINDDIPLWINHQNIEFKTTQEMLSWTKNDAINFTLSDMVYSAMIDCLKNNMEQIIVSTIIVKGETKIDVVIRKANFQKILSAYTERLLKVERYEKLAEIKQQIEKYGLEM